MLFIITPVQNGHTNASNLLVAVFAFGNEWVHKKPCVKFFNALDQDMLLCLDFLVAAASDVTTYDQWQKYPRHQGNGKSEFQALSWPDRNRPSVRMLRHEWAKGSLCNVNGLAQLSQWSCSRGSSFGAEQLGQVKTVSCKQNEHSQNTIENNSAQWLQVHWCRVFSSKTSKPSVSLCPQAGQVIASIFKTLS
jgi:hypothetical protein